MTRPPGYAVNHGLPVRVRVCEAVVLIKHQQRHRHLIPAPTRGHRPANQLTGYKLLQLISDIKAQNTQKAEDPSGKPVTMIDSTISAFTS